MSLYNFYLDDSKWETDSKRYIFWGGFLVKDDDETELIKNFSFLKRSWGLSEFDPIKWTPSKKEKIYSPQRDLISRQNDFKEAVLKFISNNNVTLIGGALVIPSREDWQKPVGKLLNDLAIRFQFYIQEQIKNKRCGRNSYGSMIVGFPSSKESKYFSDQYYGLFKNEAVLESQNMYREDPCVAVNLKYLDPGLYFCYEPHSPLMQISDFIASCCMWTFKNNRKNYFDLIKPKFRRWNGNIKGAGLIGAREIVDKILY